MAKTDRPAGMNVTLMSNLQKPGEGKPNTKTYKRCPECSTKWIIEEKGEACPECPAEAPKKKAPAKRTKKRVKPDNDTLA